jgi:hypothetical protein
LPATSDAIVDLDTLKRDPRAMAMLLGLCEQSTAGRLADEPPPAEANARPYDTHPHRAEAAIPQHPVVGGLMRGGGDPDGAEKAREPMQVMGVGDVTRHKHSDAGFGQPSITPFALLSSVGSTSAGRQPEDPDAPSASWAVDLPAHLIEAVPKPRGRAANDQYPDDRGELGARDPRSPLRRSRPTARPVCTVSA